MATYHMENGSTGNQYYFNANTATTSQSYRTQASPVPTYNSSEYASYPTGHLVNTRSPYQSIRVERNTYDQDDSYRLPQQHQSVAGFSKNVTQHFNKSSAPPQVRARILSVGNQDQYPSSQPIYVSPQQQHFQFDSRQQPGHPTGPPVVYQTPGAAQFTHQNVDLWTENTSRGRDQLAQAQRVSVRSVSTGSPQQSHSVSPNRPQDSLQQYYSQLTPEQHQQILRQQQLQRQQQQQQQHHTVVQQVSPSSIKLQDQYRSTASATSGGHQHIQVSPNQQSRVRSDSERQRQDEQDFYAAQRQLTAQRIQPSEQSAHPVGIRSLMTKFAGPTSINQPRSRSTSSRQFSSSSYTSKTTSNQPKPGNRLSNMPSMTYSALPKPREPPVNSVEYYQMQMQQHGGQGYANIQQAAAPAHIQNTTTGLGSLHDRFAMGSQSGHFPPPQQQEQRQPPKPAGSSLTSLRDQYMYRAKESAQDDLPAQPMQNISRTIVGEDLPGQKASASTTYQQPIVSQVKTQNDNSDQQAGSSDGVTSPHNDTSQAEPEVSN